MLKRFRRSPEVKDHILVINHLEVPVKIHFEYRHNWRISFGKSSVLLRVTLQDKHNPTKPLEWAKNWLIRKYQTQPQIFNRFFVSPPSSGKIYHTQYGSFELRLFPESRATAKGIIQSNQLHIQYPETWNPDEQKQYLPQLVSRVFAHTFYTPFSDRVFDLNETFFQFEIGAIRLKYNKSNWGSCSVNKNLNFSTRLFLTPPAISDYVIIHELAHLKFMNHSTSYWKLVEKAIPDYKQRIGWLKENGSLLFF
jgi:hypothetical protein